MSVANHLTTSLIMTAITVLGEEVWHPGLDGRLQHPLGFRADELVQSTAAVGVRSASIVSVSRGSLTGAGRVADVALLMASRCAHSGLLKSQVINSIHRLSSTRESTTFDTTSFQDGPRLMHMETLAGLNCRLVGPTGDEAKPQAVVVLCHGFGAGGDDLVPLAVELQRLNPTLKDEVLFVFPEGPLCLPEIPGGRAWWPIDLESMQRASQAGELRQMRQDTPPLLPEARQKLMGAVDVLRERTGLPLSQVVLGGFSQGSMLATDVALRLDENVGGLVVYSGTLLIEPEWRQLAAAHRGLQVLQSHGMIDPLLPYEAALWLRDLLQSSGAEVEFVPFHGTHTIPQEAVASTARLIGQVVAGANAR